MANYITLHQKSIQQKLEISKLMTEIIKHNGDVKGAIDDSKGSIASLDFAKLKELARNANSSGDQSSEKYVLKK